MKPENGGSVIVGEQPSKYVFLQDAALQSDF